MSGERANFDCPRCDSSEVYRVNGSDRFKCENCGLETLEKVGNHIDELQALAESDLPASELAELLLRGKGG